MEEVRGPCTSESNLSNLFLILFPSSLPSVQSVSWSSFNLSSSNWIFFPRTPFFFRRRLKGIHSKSDKNRTGAESLSFYYPRLLYCLNQMLAVVLLSQHRVLSSKTVRPRAPCGARCIGHAVRTWSAVCQRRHTSNFFPILNLILNFQVLILALISPSQLVALLADLSLSPLSHKCGLYSFRKKSLFSSSDVFKPSTRTFTFSNSPSIELVAISKL